MPVPFTIDSLPATVDERVALWLWDQPTTQMSVSFGETAAHEPDPFDWLAGITIDLTHQRNFRPKPTPSNAVISILVNGRSVLWVPEQHGLVSEIYPDWWLEVRQLMPSLDPSHRQRVDQEFDLMIFFWQWVVGAQE